MVIICSLSYLPLIISRTNADIWDNDRHELMIQGDVHIKVSAASVCVIKDYQCLQT